VLGCPKIDRAEIIPEIPDPGNAGEGSMVNKQGFPNPRMLTKVPKL